MLGVRSFLDEVHVFIYHVVLHSFPYFSHTFYEHDLGLPVYDILRNSISDRVAMCNCRMRRNTRGNIFLVVRQPYSHPIWSCPIPSRLILSYPTVCCVGFSSYQIQAHQGVSCRVQSNHISFCVTRSYRVGSRMVRLYLLYLAYPLAVHWVLSCRGWVLVDLRGTDL